MQRLQAADSVATAQLGRDCYFQLPGQPGSKDSRGAEGACVALADVACMRVAGWDGDSLHDPVPDFRLAVHIHNAGGHYDMVATKEHQDQASSSPVHTPAQ